MHTPRQSMRRQAQIAIEHAFSLIRHTAEGEVKAKRMTPETYAEVAESCGQMQSAIESLFSGQPAEVGG